jgi:hypothetical protein
MGNNPVTGIDPDGRVVIETAILVKFAIKAAKVAIKAAKVAKKKKTAVKLISATRSGGMNSLYNYEKGQSPLVTFAYFAGGFVSGFIGADVKGIAAYMLGGIVNTTVGIMTGNADDGFSMAQHFVGGGLAAHGGKSFSKAFFGKTGKAKTKNALATPTKEILTSETGKAKSKMYEKGTKKFMSYGAEGTARDFEQAKDWESYKKKDMGHHFGTFFISGLGGLLQKHAGDNKILKKAYGNIGYRAARFGFNMMGYGLEYLGMSYVKGNYQSLYTKGWERKAEIYGFKSIMYILIP